jgi:hypothetical protein
VELRSRKFGQDSIHVLVPVQTKKLSRGYLESKSNGTHDPPGIVNHLGFPMIWSKWWLYMNLISVRAGKSRAHVSGGVDQIAAVIGYEII